MSVKKTHKQDFNHQLKQMLGENPRVPVVSLKQLDDLPGLIKRLADRDIGIIEVTLRTPVALQAIATMKREYPQFQVGAGTVRNSDEFASAVGHGADFIVSPGFLPSLSAAADEHQVALLPGVATPGEIMQARHYGHNVLKLFPAAPLGGVTMLKSLAGPFPEVLFCPTGGIQRDELDNYLAQKNVLAVGASWLAET